jgi:four helix bundle protein
LFGEALGIDPAHRRGMTTTFTYRDLEAWKRGMDLVEQCYKLTASFPKSEQFALTSQIRRAAVSVPSNLAEGHCRRTTKAYANHVSIALGSHAELGTCIEVASRLGFISPNEKQHTIVASDSVGRLLNGLYRSLECRLAASLDLPPRASSD